jgi:hypothetical protein
MRESVRAAQDGRENDNLRLAYRLLCRTQQEGASMNAMRIFFCCAVLAVAGCVLDGPEESDDPVADELEEAALQYEDVISSLHRTADGQYASDLGPVEVIPDDDADPGARDQGGAVWTSQMNVCWWDQGYRHCCGGSECCVWIDGYRYCG